jgi:hypothetical protein
MRTTTATCTAITPTATITTTAGIATESNSLYSPRRFFMLD